MKVIMVSNYFNHHQKAFCDAMYKKLKNNFYFIATREMGEERKQLGYQMVNVPEYVILSYIDNHRKEFSQYLIDEADIVIFGSAPQSLLKERKRRNKIIFRYEERPLKKGNDLIRYIPRLIKWRWNNYPGKSTYMLCASAYTAGDYAKFGLFRNRAYKWGYFPEVYKYEIDKLLYLKNRKLILWCGRLIDWKHPELTIEIAKRLKEEGYDFKLKIIGAGRMERQLIQRVEEYQLKESVEIAKAMKPEEVRKNMEQAGIYVFTSDYNEGWGAVLNEAMNSGCAVVASHAIGAVPFLIDHESNGLIYINENLEDLYLKIKFLLDNSERQIEIGKKAYKTIVELWNSDVAAERFLDLCNDVIEQKTTRLHKEGPCSKAMLLSNKWFISENKDV